MEKKTETEIEIKMEKEQIKSECKAHYDAVDRNDKLVINFRDINRTMRFLYEGRESQKRILMILLEAAPITQRSLTERLGIQPGSASEVLAKLEKGGLIARTESLDDRRTTDITLTGQGRLLAEEALKQRKVRHEEMFSCLTEEEKSGLLTLLEKINVDWQERYQGIGERSCRKHGHKHEHDHEHESGHKHGHDFEHEPCHKHGHDFEHDPGHKHGHDFEHDPGHKHGHGFEHDPGHKHEHEPDREHESGHKHGHDFEHEPCHKHGHDFEHESEQRHESGRKNEYEHNPEHSPEHNPDNVYFQSHNNERSGCDGNCQDCKHPCKRGIGREKFSDEHDSGSHHQEK